MDPKRVAELAEAVRDYREKGYENDPLIGEDWADYTRWALGVESYRPREQREADTQEQDSYYKKKFGVFLDRKRTLGVDFGPEMTGVALSMGSEASMPLGTYESGKDWKQLAIKIVQTTSTRRARDIVIGHPLEKDGSEGKISVLVRHFAQLVADAALMMLGGQVKVYLWDERFSTTYAAMRLSVRPRFQSGAFKAWIDGQRGLISSGKSLLDSEAARAILEHFLAKDPKTKQFNKERADRVLPSKEAARAYLVFKKRRGPKVVRPKEPAGPQVEGLEWEEMHPEQKDLSYEELEDQDAAYQRYMRGMGNWGDKRDEWLEKRAERRDHHLRKKNGGPEDKELMKQAMRDAIAGKVNPDLIDATTTPQDSWDQSSGA